jgi:hypothetical protein
MLKSGATTLSVKVHSKMTFSLMTLKIKGLFGTLSIKALSVTTFSLMTLSIKGLFATLRINYTYQK